MSLESLVSSFTLLEKRLKENHPDQIAVANELAESLADPETSDAGECWPLIWDKPIYANNRVPVADRQVVSMSPYMKDAWKTAGIPGSDFHISKIGKSTKTEDYVVTGELASILRDECRIAAFRLFRIQGAAAALRQRAGKNPSAPYAQLAWIPVREAVEILQREMGSGWGIVTCLHFLTDMGLACKPDIHLMRTMRRFSLVPPGDGNPNIEESILVNERIRELSVALYGNESPRHVRYLDKMLMEFSRQGLV